MNHWDFNIIPFNDFDESLSKIFEDAIESSESGNVFFHPSLIKAWVETYRSARKMHLFLVRAKSADNEALIPMALWYRNWKNAFINSIIPVGYSDFDYHDPIFYKIPTTDDKSSFWNGIIKLLKSEYDYDNITFDGITDSITDCNCEWQKDEICPFLDLASINNEAELMSFFKTSLRGDIRRQIRRLEEIGKLEYHEYHSWKDIPASSFDEFMRQHCNRWPNAYKAPHFHENLLIYGLKSNIVHFSTLTVGGKEIAWHLGFSFRRRFYYYMPAGNQDYFKYSPTKIHLFYLVRRAVDQGYAVFDHLRGEENYKSGWSNGSQYVNHLTVTNARRISKFKFNLLKMRTLLPPPIHTNNSY